MAAAAAVNLWTARAVWDCLGRRLLRGDTSVLYYYTNLSNLFAAGACVLCAAAEVWSAVSGRGLTRWAKLLKYLSACVLSVTLTVVLTILGPQDGYRDSLFGGTMLYLHTLCPLAAMASFVLLERETVLPRWSPWAALAPTLVYGTVMLTLNIQRRYAGPYSFFRVYAQPWYMTVFWMTVIVAGAYLLALGLYFANSYRRKKR